MKAAASLKLEQARREFESGRADLARATLQRALQQHPGSPELSSALSLVMVSLGSLEQAAYFAGHAAQARPQEPAFWLNLGNVLALAGKQDEARDAFERSLALATLPGALQGLANILRGKREYVAAAEHARRLLAIDPGSSSARTTLGAVLLEMGRAREAVAELRAAQRLRPRDMMIGSGLCCAMNYAGDLEPEEVFAAHRAYGELVAGAIPLSSPPPAPSDPERTLRVGVLSADFRRHATRCFIEPLLALGDGFETHCYSSTQVEDEVSAHLRSRAAGWRHVPHLSPADLARQIRADRIDILIELGGHTAGQRLPMLRTRPAPIQMTYIGYPNTTGLSEMDYRIVDSITDPPGPADALATERLLRLDPCFLCYVPLVPPPPDEPLPRTGSGPRFASFNALSKLDDATIALWADLLGRVPDASLLLKYHGLASAAVRADLHARFAGHGADPSRIVLEPPGAGPAEMFEAYRRVDVALDTFPYHGTTTTCEALLMGVPVVTLQGRVCAARVGPSLLKAVGLPDLIADSPDAYVAVASRLATDDAWRTEVRRGLRRRFLASPICDIPACAARLAAALRACWREACARPATG